MHYSITDIANIIGAAAPAAVPEKELSVLLTDSRRLTNPSQTVFFALDGPRRSGHIYIKELYDRGVRCFIVSKDIAENDFPGAVFLKVPDVLLALQQVAAARRTALGNIPVIGITGSNGKTMVKEWLYQLLQADEDIVRSPKSYNSQIGVPLSVWQMSGSNTLGIFEAGISQAGEMARLQPVIQPAIGVLTNIGQAHSEGFRDDVQKIQEKLKLFTGSKTVIACGDEEQIRNSIHAAGLQLCSWGYHHNNNVRVLSIDKQGAQTVITVLYKEQENSFVIPFTDNAAVENAITCYTVLKYLGKEDTVINSRMRELQPVHMRLEFKKGINNCIIINDSYSADINALPIALDFLQQQSKQQSKTVILSDFADDHEGDPSFYKTVIRLLANYGVRRLIGIGPRMQAVTAQIVQEDAVLKTAFYASTQDFLNHFQSGQFKEEAILVKGGRAFEFEDIVAVLEQKVHQTILEINLDAIAHNLKVFQSLIKPATKVMVMVKAFAYGSGGAEIGNVLQYHKADYLGVAYADEGVELRKAGVTLPIMVLNPEPEAFDAITDYSLEPDMYSFSLLKDFQQHLQQSGHQQYPVHIEIETGMHRLGFNVDEIPLLGSLLQTGTVRVQSVFSHLAASEDMVEDAFTLQQYELLQSAAGTLEKILGYTFIKHIANSAAIVRLPQLQMDMVRLGIGLYGVVSGAQGLGLKPAATLCSTISQLKELHTGDTVSYNRRGVIKGNTRIATVRIGYADGYARRLGNGVGAMLVKGVPAPVVGTVCMDMVMLDVTHIEGVQEGDDVIVFGEALPIEQVAQWAGTIPYEIMTGISQRVKRVYYGE